VVAVRLLLLALAVGAVVVAILIGVAGRGGDDDAGARFACPMHPEVVAKAPGQCPICRMALEPTGRSTTTPRPGMGGMVDTTAIDNVRKHKFLEFVRIRSLLPHLRDLRAPAWVEEGGAVSAVFYNDQITVIANGEPGSFTLMQTPGAPFRVRRLPDAPVPWDRSTSRIRFAVDAKEAPAPGRAGWLEIERKPREVLGVPSSAIVQSPEGPYVLLAQGGGRFQKRAIEIGETFVKQGFAVVLSGLQRNDLVVSKATFFLEADRRLGLAGEQGAPAP
jgi:hypothetical protein